MGWIVDFTKPLYRGLWFGCPDAGSAGNAAIVFIPLAFKGAYLFMNRRVGMGWGNGSRQGFCILTLSVTVVLNSNPAVEIILIFGGNPAQPHKALAPVY